MPSQELLSLTIGNPLPPLNCELLLVALIALAALTDPSYESFWQTANRISDKYLQQLVQDHFDCRFVLYKNIDR